MLHGTPIQQRHETTYLLERVRRTCSGNLRDDRLQIPQDVRGFRLAEWQQSLVRRYQACGTLVKKCLHRESLRQIKSRAYQPKRRGVVYLALRGKRRVPGFPKSWKIAKSQNGLKKISPQRCARGPALTRALHRT